MKYEYDLLKKIFSGPQMSEISRFVNERETLVSEEAFIEMIFEETVDGLYFINDIEERSRIIKNAIILSSLLSGMGRDLDGIDLLHHAVDNFKDFQVSNGKFELRQLEAVIELSNNLAEGHYIEERCFDIDSIRNLALIHIWLIEIKKSNTLDPKVQTKSYWQTENFKSTCPFTTSAFEDLVKYLFFIIENIVNKGEELKFLLDKSIILNDLKIIIEDIKSDYNKNDDDYDAYYADKFTLKTKPSFNELLILILDKDFNDLGDHTILSDKQFLKVKTIMSKILKEL